eukprot:tig00021234_g19420.t1
MGQNASALVDDIYANVPWRKNRSHADSRLLASGELRVLFIDGCSSGTAQLGPLTDSLNQLRRLASDAGLAVCVFEPEPALGPGGRDCHLNENDEGVVRRALMEAMAADFVVAAVPEAGMNWRELDVGSINLADRVALEFPFLQGAKDRTLSEWCLRAALLRTDRRPAGALVAAMSSGPGGPAPGPGPRPSAFGFDIASLGIGSRAAAPPPPRRGRPPRTRSSPSSAPPAPRSSGAPPPARPPAPSPPLTAPPASPPSPRSPPRCSAPPRRPWRGRSPRGAPRRAPGKTSLGRLHQANAGAAAAALAGPLAGRDELIARLDAYAASSGGHEAPFVLAGGPGSGKTAVAAHWAARFGRLHPEDVLVSFHARCCRDAGSLSSALRYLAAELEARLAWPLRDLPVADPRAAGRVPPAPFVGALESDEAVIRAFPGLLARAALAAQISTPQGAPPRRVLVVVDGVDQFGAEGLLAASAREGEAARREAARALARFVDQLQWLPHAPFAPQGEKRPPVPANLRVVLTCSPEFAEASIAPRGVKPLALPALRPELLQEALLQSPGAQAALRSRPDLLRRLAAAPLAALPLFAALADRRLALAETERDAEEAARALCGARTPAEAVAALIARVAAGPEAARPGAVRSVLARLMPALGAARFGLTEAECAAVAGLGGRPHEWLELRSALEGPLLARHAGLVRLASPTPGGGGPRLVEEPPPEGFFRRIAALCTPPPDPPRRAARDLYAPRRALARPPAGPPPPPPLTGGQARAGGPGAGLPGGPWLLLRGAASGPGGAGVAPESRAKVVALLTDPDIFLFAAQCDFATLLRYWRALAPAAPPPPPAGPGRGGGAPRGGGRAGAGPHRQGLRAPPPRALLPGPRAPAPLSSPLSRSGRRRASGRPRPGRQVALGLALSAVGDLQRCLDYHEGSLDHYRHGVEACGPQAGGGAGAMQGRLLLAMGETLAALWDRDLPPREAPVAGCCGPSAAPPDRAAGPGSPRVEDPLPVLLERGAPERAVPLLARALDVRPRPAPPQTSRSAERGGGPSSPSPRPRLRGRGGGGGGGGARVGACEALRRARGGDDDVVWAATEALAKVHLAARSYPPALELLSGILAKRRRELGQGSEPAARAAMALAAAQRECGALKEASHSASEALAAYRKARRPPSARRRRRAALSASAAVRGGGRADAAGAERGGGGAAGAGDLAGARDEYERHPQAARAQAELAAVLLRLGEAEAALETYRAAQGALERALGETADAHVACVEGMAQCYESVEKGRQMKEAALLAGANLADVLLRHRAPAPPNAADLHRALELYSKVLAGAERGSSRGRPTPRCSAPSTPASRPSRPAPPRPAPPRPPRPAGLERRGAGAHRALRGRRLAGPAPAPPQPLEAAPRRLSGAASLGRLSGASDGSAPFPPSPYGSYAGSGAATPLAPGPGGPAPLLPPAFGGESLRALHGPLPVGRYAPEPM